MSKTSPFPQDEKSPASHAGKSPHQLLAELLSEIFDENELRRFISNGADTRTLVNYLPGVGAPLFELVDSFIGSAYRRGLLTARFFERLAEERPHRMRSIESLANIFPSLIEVSPEYNHARTWFSFRLKLGPLMISVVISMVVFCLGLRLLAPPTIRYSFLLHVSQESKLAIIRATIQQTETVQQTPKPAMGFRVREFLEDFMREKGLRLRKAPQTEKDLATWAFKISPDGFKSTESATIYCESTSPGMKSRLATLDDIEALKPNLEDGYYWISSGQMIHVKRGLTLRELGDTRETERTLARAICFVL